jgi:Domain of unknown function (DUF1793).
LILGTTTLKVRFSSDGMKILGELTHQLADWELFTAAIASKSTQQMFIKDIATWINETPTNRALTDLYDTSSGE